MQVLLLLEDPASQCVCGEYFHARGCEVDLADDLSHAERLLLFRRYDLLVADLPQDDSAMRQWERLLESARRGNPSITPVALTTNNDLVVADQALTVLTKPQPLAAILQLAGGGAKRRGLS